MSQYIPRDVLGQYNPPDQWARGYMMVNISMLHNGSEEISSEGVKYLSRVMKDYADVLYPLEEAIAGRNPSEKIAWTDHLTAVFKRSQNELRNVKTLTILLNLMHKKLWRKPCGAGILKGVPILSVSILGARRRST